MAVCVLRSALKRVQLVPSQQFLSPCRLNPASLLPETDEAGKVAGRRYTSVLCPRPGMSEEARAQLRKEMEAMEAKVKAEIARLRPLADRDGSGFVSSEEGHRFRNLYEMGRSVLVVTAGGLRDGGQAAERLQIPAEKLQEDLAAYAAVKGFSPLPELKFSNSR